MVGVADREAENGPSLPEIERDGHVRLKEVDFEPPKKLPIMPPRLAIGDKTPPPGRKGFPMEPDPLTPPMVLEPRSPKPLAMLLPTDDPASAMLLPADETPLETDDATDDAALEILLPIELNAPPKEN